MPQSLPDRMTVKLQVMQRFQELGQDASPQQIIQATDETMGELRKQYFQSLPVGVARYEMEGKKDSAGFLKRMVHTADTMGHNLVAGSVGVALSQSDSQWAVRTSEDLRKWANDNSIEQVARDPELQAYYSWKEDEPSWSGGFDTTMRAMSEVIPSLATSIASTGIALALAPATGGTSLMATTAALVPMFLLESSSDYIEQMNLMVDEMGMTPEEANQYAGLAAVTYGTVASVLERTGARSLMKGVPGFKNLVPEKAMLRKITESLVESGSNKGTLARMGMNNVARLTNVIEKAMVEGGTEWSQASLQQVSLYATENGFKNNREFLKTLSEVAKSEGVLEEAFAGGVMGVPFGLFLPGSGKVVSQKQSEKIMEAVKNKHEAGGFDQDLDETTDNVVNDYLSALANPRERMGEFWDNFKPSAEKSSKSIERNRNSQSGSNAILSLIVDEPNVIADIENHVDRDTILKLAVEKLNQQNPTLRQINTEDTQEMINALKMFSQKGSIKEKEAPDDLSQSPEPPEISFDPVWLNEQPNESLFYPKEEPISDPTVSEEPSVAQQQALREKIAKKVKTPEVKAKPDVPDKSIKGTTITLPDVLEGKNIQGMEGKQVAILGAGAKMYKIREVGKDGKLTGGIKYVKPSQIQKQTTPDVAPTTKQQAPKVKAKPKAVTDKVTKEDIFGEPEVPEEQSPTPTVKTETKAPTGIIGKKGETKVETIVDAKGRTLTYFATTKDKGEVKHTTYTFNRSDKKESQRNKGGVSQEVAFGDKYKVEEGYLEEFGEDYGDVWTVHKVFEVREGKGAMAGKASADVTLINQNGDKLTDITLKLQKKKPKVKKGKSDIASMIAEVEAEKATVEQQAPTPTLPKFSKDLGLNKKEYTNVIEGLSFAIDEEKEAIANKDFVMVDERRDQINKLRARLKLPKIKYKSATQEEIERIKKESPTPEESNVTAADIEGKPELPEGVPDVNQPVDSIEELESDVLDNQLRAEQRTKDYLIDGVSYKRVSNVIGTTYSGESNTPAIKAGNTVDSLVRNFFTDGTTPVYTDINISKNAFDDLMRSLGKVKKVIDEKGFKVLANNIIVWDDVSGVAGEVDLFVLNPKTGNIQIWDIKTSKASTKSSSYTNVFKGNGIERSKKQQHEAQLSAYKRLVENQYGVEVEKIAIFPFKVNYNKRGKIISLLSESGVSLDFNESFIDSIIAPNTLSQNIVRKEIVEEDVEGKPPQEPISKEEPDDSQIAYFKNTIMGNMASKTSEETGQDVSGDIVQDQDEDREMFQEERVSKLPKITSNTELAEKIVSRLRRNFGDYITDSTFEGVLQQNGKRAVGVAIRNVALWSSTDATLDTMPHEYAHIYVGLLKDTDLIKRGIKQFGTEEKLVQYIGEYYANRIQNKNIFQRIKIWLKQFANRLKNIFSAVPDDALGDFVAEEFYQGRWAGKMGLKYSPYAMYQEQAGTDEDGINTGVNTSRHSSKDIPSDVHQTEFFHKVFGVHISKSQVPILSDFAQSSDSFEEYVEAIKDWAGEQAKEKSYRVNIKTEYNKDDLNDLKIMYLKDIAKISRFVLKEQMGIFTRVYMSLIMPVNKATGTNTEIIVAPVTRLDTLSAESQHETTNFFEEDLRKGNHNKKILFLRDKDLLNKWKNPDTGEDVYWKASSKLNREVLNKIEASNIKKYINQVIKYGKEDANFIFILGMKGGNDNAILMGKGDNQYSNFTERDFEDYLNSEVAAGRMNESHAKVMLEDWSGVDEETAIKDANEFLDSHEPVLLEGEDIQAARIRIARQILPVLKNMKIQEGINIHEYMKSMKYNTYAMDEKHILDTYTRLRLDVSSGYSPKTLDGSLSSKVMVVPKDTIVRVMSEDGQLLEAGVLADGDGHTMTGSSWFSKLGDNIGTPNLSALKTVIRNRSKDGNDYIAMKHLQMIPFVGEQYYRPNENFPFARVAEDSDGTYFESLDSKGNVIETFQHLNTANESKQRAGKFAVDYEVNDLMESDVKVIMNPVGSSNTAAHAIALGEIILDPSVIENENTPEARNLVKAIAKHYGEVADGYLKMIKSMRKNPKTFLDAVKRTREEGRIPTDAEKYMDLLSKLKGQGVSHKYITNLFVSYLKNRYFTDGIYKGKQLAKGNATHAYLKPAKHLENLIQDGNVAISYDNSTVKNKVIKNWASLNRASIESQIPRASKWNDFELWGHFVEKKTDKERIDILNESLTQGDGVHVLIHRQPIAKVTGVVTRRIQFLVAGGHGDTMFLKKKDVSEVLDGDWDGDHGFAEFIEGDFLKAYQNWQASDTFKNKDRVVALPMFSQKLEDMEDSNTSYLSKESRDASILGSAAVSGSQGRSTNAKVVMTQLAYKKAKVYLPSLEGGFIAPRNPNDSTILKYIALDENQLNKNNGELIDVIYKNNDTIVDEGGNETEAIISGEEGSLSINTKDEPVYLKTTVEGELSILLQMTVDDKKFGLLSKIGWNNDFILNRIFKRSDGEELNKGNIKSLRVLFNVQNFSNVRAGMTASKNVASMSKIIEDSRDLSSRFFTEEGKQAPKEEVGLQMRREFLKMIDNMRFKPKNLEIPTLIDTNGKITPGEFLITRVGLAYNEMINDIQDVEKAGSHFLDWSEEAYQTAHSKTINELGNDVNFDVDKWSESDSALAYEFLVSKRLDVLNEDGEVIDTTSFNDAFWNIYHDAQRDSTDDVPLHISADYNKFLNKFVEDHVEDWLALPDKVQDLVSALFLKGIGKKTNILTLMPIDLMSERVLLKFLPLFDKNLKNLTDNDFSAQTGQKRATSGYQNFAKLSIKGSKAYRKAGQKMKPRCK